MEVHLTIIHPKDFLIAKAGGILDKNASLSMLSKIVADHPDGEDLLFDLRDAQKFAASILDVIEIVKYMLENRRTFSNRIAILGEREKAEHPGFFEDFAYNRGLNVKVFRDFEEAIMWVMRIKE